MNATRPDTIPGIFEDAGRRYPDAEAYAAGRPGRASITWAQLQTEILACAAGLVGLGLNKGDRVGIVAQNSIEWVIACGGAMRAGGIVVPVYYDLKETEIASQLSRTGCRI